MNLRRQLLLVSLLLLALPWAGCQYVREMEGALQSGQVRALQATARAVATVTSDQFDAIYPQPQRLTDTATAGQLYATRVQTAPIVDGYGDGWSGTAHARYGAVEYQARVHQDSLFLLFTVHDDSVVYQDTRQATRATGDRLILVGANGRYVISTAAPGMVQARVERGNRPMGFEPRIRGYWQDSLSGYSIELSLPLALLAGRLGFELVDVTRDDTRLPQRSGNMDTSAGGSPPWLVSPSPVLARQLASFSEAGIRLDVIDRQGWLAATAEADETVLAATADTPWLLRALYRAILKQSLPKTLPPDTVVGRSSIPLVSTTLALGEPQADWYQPAQDQQRKLLVVTAPIVQDGIQLGAVLAQQSNEPYLSLTDQAFSRLLYWSLLAILASALGLLGYASWLSWRIRKLSLASTRIIQADGSVSGDFPVSRATDELGELSRQYAELIARLREYTDYLRSLSRKLSHELRTPIAVIQSSLDNISAETSQRSAGETEVYVARAREGLARLSAILTAMSEASRLEESVHGNTPQRYDINAMLQALVAAYQDLYPQQQVQLAGAQGVIEVEGVPDLMAQMLDKLMDNAASFAPTGGCIVIAIAPGADSIVLTVSNDGPLLPEAMQGQLFDSMVSVRNPTERMHLGLGLHIVKLIVDFHQGAVRAFNREDASGVVFELSLPRQLRA